MDITFPKPRRYTGSLKPPFSIKLKVPLFKGDLGGSPRTHKTPRNFKVPLLKGDLGGSSTISGIGEWR